MRVIGAMADRVLSAFVPKTTAAACIGAESSFKEECYCSGSRVYIKNCVSTCFGPACGSCYNSGIFC